ncbi:hypothetical protein [Synechocystis sp. LEGE 06083]|uniref:hypothetical protein n=1 Tax=Synechocystis sp. LEGE 06083 TaxID=915336 RepID=UPI001881EDE8|nr:hypothetical protein [Synechocystis sp. LEGE 06083]
MSATDFCLAVGPGPPIDTHGRYLFPILILWWMASVNWPIGPREWAIAKLLTPSLVNQP